MRSSSPSDALAAPDLLPPASQAKKPPRLHVLVVEDDPIDATVVTRALRRREAEVTCVTTIDEARALFKRTEIPRFAIALIDLYLPDGWYTDTLDMIERLAEQVPVIVMSGSEASLRRLSHSLPMTRERAIAACVPKELIARPEFADFVLFTALIQKQLVRAV